MARRKKYPLKAFLEHFGTEARCQEYLASLRGKEGYTCPKCGECPNALLKEIKERKGDRRLRIASTKASFFQSEAIVSVKENRKDSLQIFQLSWKTPAAPSKAGNVVTKISIHALYRKCVFLVMDIANMFSRKDHIQIATVPVHTICFCL